ncbi:MAG: thioredoxin [Candidatus Thermoplasmatota archaeon]|nr:thioredoxin [Candidatus Thermoplasmatota archaeon]
MTAENGLTGKLGFLGKSKEEPFGDEIPDVDLKWPKGTVDVADRNFDDVLKKYPLVVVDCWAQWCGPCRIVGPIIERMAKTHRGKILFCKLNIERNRITPKKYNVKSIPTILIFKNGSLVDRRTGIMPRKKLEPAITKYL